MDFASTGRDDPADIHDPTDIDPSDIHSTDLIPCAPPPLAKDAINKLAALGDERASDAFERLLMDRHEDHRLRMLAARALGQMGRKDSVQTLIKALDDEYPSVRHEAIVALGRIGNTDACPALMRLLQSKSRHLRGTAARSLIQILGVPKASEDNIGLLISLLSSADMRIDEALLSAGLPARDALTKMLEDDSLYLRSQASRVLALQARRMLDLRPSGMDVFPWLEGHGIDAQAIGRLYSFRIAFRGKAAAKVENSCFDTVSKTLCGKEMLQLAGAASRSAPKDEAHETIEETIVETIDLKSLLSSYGARGLRLMGRTLVAATVGGCLAIKLCAKEGDEAGLIHESRMQRHLQDFGLSSRIPQPQGGLFQIMGLPSWAKGKLGLASGRAICYIASPDYFCYLGDPNMVEDDLKRGLTSCAEDLGRLAGDGLFHDSLIPLFHNRERAISGGCNYRWNRNQAGRLDNWVDSCRFPNLRLSGIADLEHVMVHPQVSSESMQARVGDHLFSMGLILGRYFCRREAFDRVAMRYALEDCFKGYYRALTRCSPTALDDCIDWDNLALRMNEEMRAGHAGDAENSYGPHLGLHNGPFPIPELIRAIHIASTFAVLELQARSTTAKVKSFIEPLIGPFD